MLCILVIFKVGSHSDLRLELTVELWIQGRLGSGLQLGDKPLVDPSQGAAKAHVSFWKHANSPASIKHASLNPCCWGQRGELI